MVSPRRIAVMMTNVPGEQAPREIVQRGPAYEAAFDADGTPTKACEGFARAKGITPADLEVREEAGTQVRLLRHPRREPAHVRAAPRHLPQDRPRHVLPQEHALGLPGPALLPAGALAGGPVGRHRHPVRHRRTHLGPGQPRPSLAGRAGADQTSRATTWRPCARSGVIVDHVERERLIWERTGAGGRRAEPGGRRPGRQAGRSAVPGGEAHHRCRACSPLIIWRCRLRCSSPPCSRTSATSRS